MNNFLPIAIMLLSTPALGDSVIQPNTIVTVESKHARKVYGSISLPQGSPWCHGKPTFWLVGHQDEMEAPWCLDDGDANKNNNFDYAGSKWSLSNVTLLDTQDELNVIDGPDYLDRHDCTVLDINWDGLPDIVCGVGSNNGTGDGFNEVYLTKKDGSLEKVLYGHGLNKYHTMRNRIAVTLKDAQGAPLVFLATNGQKRVDGKSNTHRMFRNTRVTNPRPTAANNYTALPFFFEEVIPRPWKRQYTDASCVIVADINGDGIDDLIVGNRNGRASFFLQDANSTWSQLRVRGKRTLNWSNARVADVTGDGIPDLIVVGSGGRSVTDQFSYIRIFEGMKKAPHFGFRNKIYFERTLMFASPDVEVLDINGDGVLDVYIVQTDMVSKETYCQGRFRSQDWWKRGNQPPKKFVPPPDKAPDVLLIGKKTGGFVAHYMDHKEPGCGYKVEKFGNNHTLLLAQGSTARPGHNLLLQWQPEIKN